MKKPQPTKKVKKPNVKFKDGKFSDLLNEMLIIGNNGWWDFD